MSPAGSPVKISFKPTHPEYDMQEAIELEQEEEFKNVQMFDSE